ncbi:MAG: hypothetical protein ABIE68_04715 [bacterium]
MINLKDIDAKRVAEEAERRGASIKVIDPEYSIFEMSFNGKKIRLWTSITDATGGATAKICRDKHLTREYLAERNFKVPDQICVCRNKDGLWFIKKYKQIVVKPVDGQKGEGISIKVSNREYPSAFRLAMRYSNKVLLEEYARGSDYRALVIGHKFVAAAKRIPARVKGDGRKTIKELIQKRNEDFRNRDCPYRIPLDRSTKHAVERKGRKLDSVLQKGRIVRVRDTANLSTGGKKVDVTNEFPKTLRKTAEEISRAFGLPTMGIDMIIPKNMKSYNIIEVNTRPALVPHSPAPAVERFVDWLFAEVKK